MIWCVVFHEVQHLDLGERLVMLTTSLVGRLGIAAKIIHPEGILP
jgi:hypothetical protein